MKVEFEGVTHEFPDDFSDDEVRAALSGGTTEEPPSTLLVAAEAPGKAVATALDEFFNIGPRLANIAGGVGGMIRDAIPGRPAEGNPLWPALDDLNPVHTALGPGTKPVGAFQENLDKALQFGTLSLAGPGPALRKAAMGATAGSAGDIAGRATDSKLVEFATNLLTPLGVRGVMKPLRWGGEKLANLGATVGAARGSQRGIDRLAADAAQRAAGDAAPQIQRAAGTATEYVPGAKPTVAEAIAEANMGQPSQFGGGVVKLQKELTGAQGIEDILPSAARAQDVAMLAPIQRMAGGATREAQDAAQAAAKTARSQGAGAQYEAIAPTAVGLDANLVTLLESSAGRQAMEIARKIASNDAAARAASGKQPIQFMVQNADGKVTGFTAQGLQHIKSALDSMASNKSLQDALGIAGTGKVAVGEVRNALVQWMNKKIPGWEGARTQYAAESLPINQRQVAQALADKLKNEKGDLTPTQFMNVLGRGEDAMLKTSTGAPRDVTIDKLFPAKDAAHIRGVGAHLARNAEMNRIAGTVRGGQAGNITSGEVPQLPNLLSREAMLVNFLLRRVVGDANLPVARELAKRSTDPKSFAELLKHRRPPPRTMRDAAAEAKNIAPVGALLELE